MSSNMPAACFGIVGLANVIIITMLDRSAAALQYATALTFWYTSGIYDNLF